MKESINLARRTVTRNPNPWHSLPNQPPFVLPEDKQKVEAFNETVQKKGQGHDLNLNLIPMPFVGRPDAPIVLLGNIAGAGEEYPDDYLRNPAYANRMRKNLLHQNADFPFLPMDPGPDTFRSHKQWWTDKLKHLLAAFSNGPEAESILARSLLAVEFFPYRSSDNRYHHSQLCLTSQWYCWDLVLSAMKRGALIVVRYGASQWFDRVRGLERYENLFLLKGIQRTLISPKGFARSDGFEKVVNALKACVA